MLKPCCGVEPTIRYETWPLAGGYWVIEMAFIKCAKCGFEISSGTDKRANARRNVVRRWNRRAACFTTETSPVQA